VDVREKHAVEKIFFDGGRAVGVSFVDDKGRPRTASAPYIVDAGGNRAQYHNADVGERVYSNFFQNVALYGYFEHGKRLPPPNQGNILCCAFKDGWFWYIPLSANLTSVGAVVSRDAAKIMQGGHKEAFEHFVEQCPMIAEYLATAKQCTEGIYSDFRIRKDYSYCSTKFWKPGLALVGDAACFIDPVFSSGVHLATYSALLAARSINTCLKGAQGETACFEEFERRYRREYGNFYQFLTAFYDMHQETDSYFWAARKILNTEEIGNEAFVRLVAGVSSEEEPLFNSADYFQARAGLGDWFQGILSNQKIKPDNAPEFDKAKFDPAKFMQGFTSEISQLQMQAAFGGERPKELPMVANGLIPSQDGFHWESATAKVAMA
jgi:FAD-dependent halogenase